MAIGDHLKVHCGTYWHHGIDVGSGMVVSNTIGGVVRESLRQFSGGEVVLKVVYKAGRVKFSGAEIAMRALSLLGMRTYNLISWNCEHFAIWCCTNVGISRQVQEAGMATIWAGAATAAAVGLAAPASLILLGVGGLLKMSGGDRQMVAGTTLYIG